MNPAASIKSRIRNVLQSIKQSSPLGGKKRKFLDNAFPTFFPSSWNYWSYPHLTYSAANLFPNQLLHLAALILKNESQGAISIEDYGNGESPDTIGELLDRYGSDKHGHEYTKVYARILKEISQKASPAILEIGLGTNNPDFISSMTAAGHPGASVRAFRDYVPQAQIFGADLDTDILFSDERIKTAKVDQTDPTSFDQMWDSFGNPHFDLVIDDGLHSTEANINTFMFATRALKVGGYLVVEDIPERTTHVWQCVSRMLGDQAGTLIKAKFAYMYVWQKK